MQMRPLHSLPHRGRGWLLAGLCLPVLAVAAPPVSPGNVFANNGNYPAAVQAFSQAHAAAPNDAAILADLARATLRQGGHNKQAVDDAQQAVALAPGKAAYQLLLGDAYSNYVDDVSFFSKLGIAHKIRDAYLKAVALDPDNATAHFSLAMYYLVAPGIAGGDVDKGKAQIAVLAKLAPALADSLNARLAMQDKQGAQAEDWLRKAAAASMDGGEEVALGAYQASGKHWDQALATLRAATVTHPQNPDAWYQIGRLAAEGHVDAVTGIKALQTYLGMPIDWHNGNQPYCWAEFHLAQIHARQGDKADARAEYQQALRLNPGFKEAEQALQKLGAA